MNRGPAHAKEVYMRTTLCFIAGFVLVIVIFDSWRFFTGELTISQVIRIGAAEWPLLPWVVGAALVIFFAHLFLT